MTPYIDYSSCTGCGACAELFPIYFEMRDGRPWFINFESFVPERDKGIVFACPFRAISIE